MPMAWWTYQGWRTSLDAKGCNPRGEVVPKVLAASAGDLHHGSRGVTGVEV